MHRQQTTIRAHRKALRTAKALALSIRNTRETRENRHAELTVPGAFGTPEPVSFLFDQDEADHMITQFEKLAENWDCAYMAVAA